MMKSPLRLGLTALAVGGALAGALSRGERPAPGPSAGSPAVLAQAYSLWHDEHRARVGDAVLRLQLGWSKGLSHEFSRARGEVVLDLGEGSVSVSVSDAEEQGLTDVWLIDNQPGPGRSVQPEPGDHVLHLGAMTAGSEGSRLRASLGPGFFERFEVDLAVVTRKGSDPANGGILFGSPTLFERLHARARRDGREPGVSGPDGRQPPALLRALSMETAHAASPEADLGALLVNGRRAFFEETFQGNGRTCGTCHPAENNFLLDPEFIATLPDDHPLFVAELNPDLASNFEKPILMRELGLILENVDGFGDLEHKFVMRAVPPTVGLRVQTQAPPPLVARIIDGTTNPPRQRTGWGGDGAPGSGTLREFAIGAVKQHFTRTLGRQAGVDFRLPTDEELDALEAFQLSLGRQADLSLRDLRLKGAVPARGKRIFETLIGIFGPAGKCNACHGNAGARDSVVPGNFVINFNTGVEDIPNQPADRLDPANPPDGGFGTAPRAGVPGAFGNGTFSTPPVVESADTGPFFHNNAVGTIEDAVRFYSTPAFNNSPAGRLVGGIDLEDGESVAVAAFLRVINALENIRLATAYQTGQQSVGPSATTDLGLAAAELEDAADALLGGGLHPDAVTLLQVAKLVTEDAAREPDPAIRAGLIQAAISLQEAARAAMVR
jgi:hypothetical protein